MPHSRVGEISPASIVAPWRSASLVRTCGVTFKGFAGVTSEITHEVPLAFSFLVRERGPLGEAKKRKKGKKGKGGSPKR